MAAASAMASLQLTRGNFVAMPVGVPTATSSLKTTPVQLAKVTPFARGMPLLSITRLPQPGQSTRRARRNVVMMANDDGVEAATSEATKVLNDLVKTAGDAWEKTDDKLAIGSLAFSAFIVLWASTGLISALDKLPLIPGALELVGVLVTGWFVYRYLLFKPDREELLKLIDETLGRITGQ